MAITMEIAMVIAKEIAMAMAMTMAIAIWMAMVEQALELERSMACGQRVVTARGLTGKELVEA